MTAAACPPRSLLYSPNLAGSRQGMLLSQTHRGTLPAPSVGGGRSVQPAPEMPSMAGSRQEVLPPPGSGSATYPTRRPGRPPEASPPLYMTSVQLCSCSCGGCGGRAGKAVRLAVFQGFRLQSARVQP